MSGSFEDEAGELNVPPTLISFAVAVGKAARAVSPEFKGLTHRVRPHHPPPPMARTTAPTPSSCSPRLTPSRRSPPPVRPGRLSPGYGCGAESLFKMCVGNQIGIELAEDVDVESLFTPLYGSFIVELAEDAELPRSPTALSWSPWYHRRGLCHRHRLRGHRALRAPGGLGERHRGVFAYRSAGETPEVETIDFRAKDIHVYGGAKIARPRVVIPVFPGNNCEYDSARAFRAAGAEADTFVINNLTPEAVAESTHELARRIRASQIVMIPGGFSGGDEPDGSAKFITAFFRAPEVTEAVRDLLKARDGLMLGICNGFQA